MTVFNVAEKQQKSHFFPSDFLLTSSLQAKSQHSQQKFSPIPSLAVNVFALISCSGRATASRSSAY